MSIRLAAIFFYFGIITFLQFEDLPGHWLYVLLPILASALYFLRNRAFLFIPLLAVLIGFSWAFARADLILANELERQIEGISVFIEGTVVSLPVEKSRYHRFQFEVDSLKDETGKSWPVPGKVRLGWYQGKQAVRPGEKWRFKVKLKRPYGFMNPGGFDYEYWLFHQGVRATGYVINDDNNKIIKHASGFSVEQFRHSLKLRLKPVLEDHSSAGLILALTLGDRSWITKDQWETLRQTGTSHLMAISGLHIGLIFAVIFFLSKHLVCLFPHLLLYWPAPRIAMIAGLIAAIIYAALAGFSLPTQRAMIMLSCAVLAQLANRNSGISSILSFALLLVLMLDPFAVLTPGFYLSFFAVGIILYVTSYRVGEMPAWWRWGRVQCVVVLALFPLTLFWFQSMPVLGVPANMIAIPVVSFTIVPLSLFASLCSYLSIGFSAWLFAQVDHVFSGLLLIVEWLASFNLSNFNYTTPTVWQLLCAVFGVVILFMPKGMPARWLGTVFLLPLFFYQGKWPQENEFWLSVLDVGQGLAMLIQTKEHALLYDTGARFSEEFNAGDAAVVPYLLKSGITKLDKIIISHGDNDHVGGLDAVLARFHADEILSSEDLHKVATRPCQSGQYWHWDGIDFELLHPLNQQLFSGNNASCVLKISNGQNSLLLSGDIEKEAELYLVENQSNKLKSDVLLVPHHGSKTSSTEAFLEAVKPELALVASGYRNRFGFPKKAIMARYQKRDIETHISAESGTILLKFNEKGMTVTKLRESDRRFWHTVP